MKTRTIQFILSICLLIQSQALMGQNCVQFFPLGQVNAIVEDSSTLWLGTEQQGLIQFDKLTLTAQYWNTSNSSIKSNAIEALAYHDDKLYISTDSGLIYLHNQNFTMVNDTIHGLLVETKDGKLAVVTVENVYFFQNGSIVYHKNLDAIAGVNPDCCENSTETLVDDSGNLWITRYAFYEFDILKFDGNTWEVFHSQNTPTFPIESFTFNGLANRGDTIYSSSWGGVQEYHQGIWALKFLNITNGIDTLIYGASLAALAVENTGAIWLGTGTEGIPNLAGQLLYHDINGWTFLPSIDSVTSIITKIKLSEFDPNRVYAASTTGLILVDKACLALSNANIEDALHQKIKVFPNPASSVVYLKTSNIEIRNIELYDMNGRKLKAISSSLEINVENLPIGNYYLKIMTNKGHLVKKFMILK